MNAVSMSGMYVRPVPVWRGGLPAPPLPGSVPPVVYGGHSSFFWRDVDHLSFLGFSASGLPGCPSCTSHHLIRLTPDNLRVDCLTPLKIYSHSRQEFEYTSVLPRYTPSPYFEFQLGPLRGPLVISLIEGRYNLRTLTVFSTCTISFHIRPFICLFAPLSNYTLVLL